MTVISCDVIKIYEAPKINCKLNEMLMFLAITDKTSGPIMRTSLVTYPRIYTSF